MAPSRVILMSCGSYNPPTNMHLRMFEIARDHLHKMGTHVVVGAVISPTHDDYPKNELASSDHRCAMLKLATQNSDWIRVSTWETKQNGWTKTRLSLQHHQNMLNAVILDANDVKHRYTDSEETNWIPENVKNSADRNPIQIKLLCGADLLESFGTPGLWSDEDIDAIVGQHGLVVITREGSNPNKFIYDSDILSKYMHNIHIVTEWIPNEVSSTKIRRALKRGESVRYLVQDSVIEYIYNHRIYEAKTVSTIKLELSTKNGNDYLNIQPKYESNFLTPSPSDVTMTTPSPVEIITIDITDSVLKKNYHNAPINARTNFTSSSEERQDNERIREKLNGLVEENANNRALGTNRVVAYPGQAKQIIANEAGESEIFCEVGLNCVSEHYNVEMEIDGKVGRVAEEDRCIGNSMSIDESEKNAKAARATNIESQLGVVEPFKFSDETPTPDDSESKVSFVLSIDVIETSDGHKWSKRESPVSRIESDFDKSPEDRDAEENSSTGSRRTNLEDTPKILKRAETKDDQLAEDRTAEDCKVDETSEPTLSSRAPNPLDPPCEESAAKRESNIEIDGKYLKSVVNARKSPKKTKREDVLAVSSETTPKDAKIEKASNDLATEETQTAPSEQTELPVKSTKTRGRKRGVIFQGSLDSINVEDSKSASITSARNHPAISKKSKSYESIEPTELQPTSIYKIPLNGSNDDNPPVSSHDASRIKSTESNSTYATANEAQESGRTDEFCSVCCYANEPSSTEAFYTLRSTGSSPLEEASTECDICSNCDLREDPEEEEKEKFVKPVMPGEPVCELCEICGDVAMDEDVVASSRPEKDDFVDRRMLGSRSLPLSLPRRKRNTVRLNARRFKDIDNGDGGDEEEEEEDDDDDNNVDVSGVTRRNAEPTAQILRGKSLDQPSTDDTNSNEDEFEIENCGLDADLDPTNDENSRCANEIEDTLRNIVPRDEVAMSGKSSRKISRAGSLISRDTIDRGKSKRRYSSVDNLPNSRQIVKTTTEKQNTLRSRGAVKGLVASADNIRPSRNNRSRATLRKSADDVGRGYHSSMDDPQELEDNVGRKKFTAKEQQQHKPRDSGTIKMILTKHGIKIISDKETAL